MKLSKLGKLKRGASVWVWVVRLGKGRWWPGAVEKVEITNGLPLVTVRFESFSLSRHHADPPVTLGFIGAPMRRLEPRAISANGHDRPRRAPMSRVRIPKGPTPGRSRIVKAGSLQFPEKT
jgi:hypothetical protein